MRPKVRPGRLALAAGGALALLFPLLAAAPGNAAGTESLTVDLGSARGAATGVGEGFLYGVNQDASQPADQYILPLGITAYRGGGHASRGWVGDNYTYGSNTKADVAEIIAQGKRFTQAPYHAQYQVILSDVYGNDGGQPSNTTYPCDNGNCSNWVSFIDATVGALQASGLKFAYDIYNEPDISVFWTRGMNSTQYFQMWDTAYREIRRIAPSAQIVGPSLAFTPQGNPGEWNTWLAHVKGASTLPDMITNHDEGDVDDPVAVSQSLNNALSSNGIARIPLSANEFQPSDRQTAGVSAWYLARFAQSGYTNAMRGNWICCTTPNLTGLLTNSGGSWQPTGNWWAFRAYADMTGTLVNTSGQVNSTAISASEDSANQRAVAIIGDSNGYTGAASVTFDGVSTQAWLDGTNSSVNVTVERIPDQAPLSSPQVVFNQPVNTSSGSITVPLTFQASHDAFAIYLTPNGSTGGHTVTVTNPGNQSTTVGRPISPLQIQATDSASGQTLVYSATGLPPGLSISTSGLISGTPTTPGTYNVTVNATDTYPVAGSASFAWTIGNETTGGACQVSYVKNEWGGGFTANVTVTNTGTAAINGWTLKWSFPGDQKVTNAWNATVSQSGQAVSAANVSYNGAIAPGGNVQFGFQGTWAGSDTSPSSFTLNGSACT